jgi:hypothetical protein
MSPSKSPMPKEYRRAYQQAGHALMAAKYQIGISRVTLKRLPGRITRSTFQSAVEYCSLQVGQFVNDDLKLDQYLSFLMAGTAADMLALEHYHGYKNRPSVQDRFREQWYKAIWERPSLRLNEAYCLIVAWSYTSPPEIWRHQLNCWHNAVLNLSFRSTWAAVEEVAQRLLAGEVLDQAAVVAVIP